MHLELQLLHRHGGSRYLEDQEDSVNRSIMGLASVSIWIIRVFHLLAKSP